METIKIPIELGCKLISKQIKSLNEEQIRNLARQILRCTEENIDPFLSYLNAPDKLKLNGLSIGNHVYCPLSQIWNNKTIDNFHAKNLIVQLDEVEHFPCIITDFDFLRHTGIYAQIEFINHQEASEKMFVPFNVLNVGEYL
jgi:hypothetical protein